ncbi:MAG: glycosyltransferase [Candidatus Pacearchaeota archaeon]
MALIDILIYLSIYLGLIATTFYILSFRAGAKREPRLYEDKELPKVSVLIPAYNEEESIEKTIRSILASDYPEKKLEIIVIDDGSKDRTLELARKFEPRIKVYTKENGGKARALNFAIEKCTGEIFFSMDADTFVEPYSLKKMVRYFKDPQIMCVSPAIVIYNPKSILQRIQAIEYLLGLFLRKTFAFLNAIHITPGAFSAYRKTFVEKYGGYNPDNLTEDLELTLRVQYHDYRIENATDAPAYTIAPNKFTHLLKQRRRWYAGLMKNLWDYKKMISPRYGDMGAFVIPIAVISIIFAIIMTTYFFFNALIRLKNELFLLNNVGFDFGSIWSLNGYILERFFFLLFSNPVFIFILLFMIVFAGYLFYASKRLGRLAGLGINLPLFFLFFATLFGFWWLVSIFYLLIGKKISWK